MENTSYLLIKASRVLKNKLDRQLKKHDITASQFSVLYQIRQNNNKAIASDVAKSLDLDRPTISAIIKRLENKKILRRTPHESDKRFEYLLINEEYLTLVDALKQESDMLNTQMFSEYSKETLKLMHSVLLDIIDKG